MSTETLSLSTLQLEQVGSTLKITINRPEVYNALNTQVIADLDQAISHLHNDSTLKGAILTGAGEKAFAAGADIAELSEVPADQTEAFSKNGQRVFNKIEKGPKPVIAAVNGFALGGGCELAMACHMRVASENAKFGQPEVNLGLVAGYGGTQRLVQLIGRTKATELLLTGDHIRAHKAEELGLVNYVTAQIELIEKCEEILAKIYEKSPLAVSLTLEAIDTGTYHPGKGMDKEAENFGKSLSSYDGKEGTKAFIEKRKPDFKGA